MQRRKLTWIFVLAGLSVFGLNACDDGDYEKYTATLDGAQENPPVSTTAAGNAVLLVSKDESRVDITVTMTSPLQGTLTRAHIHRAPRGTNGGIILDIWEPGKTPTEPFEVGSPIGRTFQFSAQQLADLRAGNLYVNVHSSRNPGGEIRGQLVRQD